MAMLRSADAMAPRAVAVPLPYRVAARRPETADTWTLELEPAGDARLAAFAPGQFAMLYAFGAGEAPISVSGYDAGTHRLAHTIRAVGAVTAALCDARPGDEVGVRGPFGAGVWPLQEAVGADVVIVAGGLGLAPLRPVIDHVLARRGDFGRVAILYGGRSPDELLYRAQLDAWARRGDIHLGVTVDRAGRDWPGRVGVVTTLIPQAGFEPARAVAFVVGPEVMMRFTVAALRQRGIAGGRIHLSLERSMHCGVGHCGHCMLGPELICRDGPVFAHRRVARWLGVREL